MENKGLIRELLTKFTSANETCAFTLYDGQRTEEVPYKQFLQDILDAAGYFMHNSIHRQNIALAASNSYEWLVAFFAISAAGNTVVLLNPDLSQDLLLQQCKHADVTYVCAEALPTTESLVDNGFNWISFAELKAADPIPVEAVYNHEPNDTVIMMFTSGTTGNSKAVAYSADNVQSYLEDLKEIMVLPDKMLLVVPLHHILGLVVTLSRLLHCQTVCMGRGMQYLIADIPVLNPSFVSMVPSVLESLVKLLKRAETKEQQQRYIGKNLVRISVGGAGVKPELCRYMMQLGIQIQSAYGMTETTGAGTCCILNDNNIGTIGKPYGRTQLRIVDGEILIKSPSVIKGYYKDPEETAKVIVDGWLHTGDMGYCDKDGYYYITGRKKNVIILSNGENVNPEEIEARFGECGAILECLVYSDGKGICADVFAKNQDTAAAYIKSYNESMPLYRQVYKVNFTPEPLPKTGSGKIKRKENK